MSRLRLSGGVSAPDRLPSGARQPRRSDGVAGPDAGPHRHCPGTPPEPHPQVAFTDLTVLPGDEPGVWLVLGLARNDSRYALETVVATVEVLDLAGTPTAAVTVPVALSILQPGATSPFRARFEQARTPEERARPTAGIPLFFRSTGARHHGGNPFLSVVQGDPGPGETQEPGATLRAGPRRGVGLARGRSIAGRDGGRQCAKGRAAGGRHGAMDRRNARGASGIASRSLRCSLGGR